MRTFPIRAALAALTLAAAVGCGEGRIATYPTRGQVLVGGKPAAGAFVVFHPASNASPKAGRPSATAADDGTFELTTFEAKDGAPAGEYAVTVQWSKPKTTPLSLPGPDQLKGRYGDPAKSGLKASVAARPQNDLEPFRLELP
jgi:hypothetical protein